MNDRHRKSDTMDIDELLQDESARHAQRSQEPASQDERRYALNVKPAHTLEDDDDFLLYEEDTQERQRPQRLTASKKPLIITLAVVGVVLVVGILGFLIFGRSSGSSVSHPEGNITADVTVSGINVKGMTYDAAMTALGSVEHRLADTIRIDVTANDQTVLTLTKDDIPYGFNTDEILRQAFEDSASGARRYDIRLKIDDAGYAAVAEKVAAKLDRKAENAKVASFNADKKEMFTYQEAVTGIKLDRADLIAQLKALTEKGSVIGTVNAKCAEEKPEYDVAYLKQNIRLLSSYTTESTNTANGMSNQALSLSSCNSSIIEPGATWSFNACTGDSNLESRGYLPASVIVEGRYEIGIGGGICQSSTTIYNAALLCGLTVAERAEHAYPASYVDAGLDATIDYGNIDLKLKNPFKHQIFLKCWMDGTILHAEFYGLPSKDFDEIRVKISEPTYTGTSMTVYASRTYYLNGKSVRTEELPSSTYIYYETPDEPDDPDEPDTPTSAPKPRPATEAPVTPTMPPSESPATPDEV